VLLINHRGEEYSQISAVFVELILSGKISHPLIAKP